MIQLTVILLLTMNIRNTSHGVVHSHLLGLRETRDSFLTPLVLLSFDVPTVLIYIRRFVVTFSTGYLVSAVRKIKTIHAYCPPHPPPWDIKNRRSLHSLFHWAVSELRFSRHEWILTNWEGHSTKSRGNRQGGNKNQTFHFLQYV